MPPGCEGGASSSSSPSGFAAWWETTPSRPALDAVTVTVSVGGTVLDGSVAPDSALNRADAALYDAKAPTQRVRDLAAVARDPAGRDRVLAR